jgi:hypothetical protein
LPERAFDGSVPSIPAVGRLDFLSAALAVSIYMYLLYRHPLRGGPILHQDRWWLVNERMRPLTDFTKGSPGIPIAIGGKVELREDARIPLAKERGGRLCHVQMVRNH